MTDREIRTAAVEMLTCVLDAIGMIEQLPETSGSTFLKVEEIRLRLRREVQDLGKLLAKSCSGAELLDIASRAAGDKHYAARIDIVDKWWDGIVAKDGDIWAS